MSEIAINVENLSKAYRIGQKEEVPDTLLSAVASVAKSPLRNFRRLSRLDTFRETGEADDLVWALRDVSFDVKRGEVVGVIGRNGAGKSTLLKILSRITEPTSGRAVIHGRVSSLLEVGTGFHPELTGRENIYMNGTILGMKKREIDAKFDEIVDFSGVEKFLDTPVKRYSSGMKVRLAFSVAAHLEPEILIIDEVLAVGDAEFQSKCLGKMQSVASDGRTVLFVSHDLGAVRRLCTRGVLLRRGGLELDEDVETTVNAYLSETTPQANDDCESASWKDTGRSGLERIEISEYDGAPEGVLPAGKPARIAIHVNTASHHTHCYFRICDQYGHTIANFDSRHVGPTDTFESGADVLVCEFEQCLLMPGRYRLDAMIITDGRNLEFTEGAAAFEVLGGAVNGRSVKHHNRRSAVHLPHRWNMQSSVTTGV